MGARRLKLAHLVAERRFDWRSPRHRRALLEDELPEDLPSELRTLAEAYRHKHSVNGPAAAAWLLQRFASLVEDPERKARRLEHVARLRAQARRRRERVG